MSTISTHLNWGSSYVVNDFYKRFVNPNADEKRMVLIGRISTVVLMILAGILALLLSNALQAFEILLQIGAGTGLLFILRWFWWRINPISEITAMVVSFCVAIYFQFIHPNTGLPELSAYLRLLIGVGITSVCWIGITFLTNPSDKKTLRSFYRLVKPGGPGWKKVVEEARQDNENIEEPGQKWDVPTGIMCMVLGCFSIYSALFATGNWIYGKKFIAMVLTGIAVVSSIFLIKFWSRMRVEESR